MKWRDLSWWAWVLRSDPVDLRPRRTIMLLNGTMEGFGKWPHDHPFALFGEDSEDTTR